MSDYTTKVRVHQGSITILYADGSLSYIPAQALLDPKIRDPRGTPSDPDYFKIRCAGAECRIKRQDWWQAVKEALAGGDITFHFDTAQVTSQATTPSLASDDSARSVPPSGLKSETLSKPLVRN